MAYYRRYGGGYTRPYRRRARRGYSAYRPRRSAPARRRRAPVRRRRTQTRQKCNCKHELTPGDRFLLAQIDPFDTRSYGAKIPDSATVPSVALGNIQLYNPTLTTGTNARAWAFLPTYTSGIIPSTETGATSWGWTASFGGSVNWDKRTDFSNTFELCRPTGHAVRISSAVAPTSAVGFVHIAVATEAFNGTSTWPFATDFGKMADYPFYRRVTLASLTQSPLTIINKYTDETAFRYSGADTGGVNTGATGADPAEFHIPWSWGAIMIAVESVNSTAPLSLEMVMHHECIPKNTGVVQGSAAAVNTPSILTAAAHVSANLDATHTEDQQDSYISQAINLAAQGASDVLGGVSESVGNVVRNVAYNAGASATQAALSVLGRGIGGVNNNPNRLAIMG